MSPIRHIAKDKLADLSDEDLLKRYRQGADPALIGILYTRYTHLVFGNCLKHLGDPEAARDAVMGIFEGLFQSLLRDEVRHFSSWLYTVSRNYCLMELRRQRSGEEALKGLFADISGGDMENPVEVHLKEVEKQEKHLALQDALDQLGQEQRTCVELMYLEGRSYKEIAEHTGLEMNKVKSHIQNGKRKLRIILGRTASVFLWLFIL